MEIEVKDPVNVMERSTPFFCSSFVIDSNAQKTLSIMAKKIIAICPQCGHNFITTKRQTGIKGAIAGAVIGSVVTVEFGPVALGGALTGAVIGFFVGHKEYCKCPKCGTTVDRPEE